MLQRSPLNPGQGVAEGRRALTLIPRGVARAAARVLGAVAHAVSRGLGAVIHAVSQVFRAIIHAVSQVFRAVVHAVSQVFRAAVHAVSRVFRAVVHAVSQVFSAVVHAISQVFRAVVHAVSRVFRAAVHTVSRVFRAVVHTVSQVFRAVVHAVSLVFRTVVHAVSQVFRAVGHRINRSFTQLRTRLNRITSSLSRTTITVSSEAGMVHAVAFRGKDVVAWGSAALQEPPSSPDETAEPPTEPPAALKKLLMEMPAGRARVVTEMPLYAPLIRHLRVPKARSSLLRQMIDSEVLETIPFEEEEVDISWKVRRDSVGQEAFAIAVPKASTDAQVQLIRDADVSPSAAYAKAVALAFAAGLPNGIVLHIEEDRVATILVRGGAPQVVHEQGFPWKATDPQEQADALALAADQVAEYYRTLSPDEEGGPWPVVLTGQLSEDVHSLSPHSVSISSSSMMLSSSSSSSKSSSLM
jgi:hypothetical protein